jgi:hypothetical protein
MSEIICIDANFNADQLKFYEQHGVTVPEQDKIYNIRAVINNSNGKIGILLEELKNPLIPFKHAILGITKNEPNWNLNRFKNLDQTEIDKEQVAEIVKLTK